jgi:hypothetical protein
MIMLEYLAIFLGVAVLAMFAYAGWIISREWKYRVAKGKFSTSLPLLRTQHSGLSTKFNARQIC